MYQGMLPALNIATSLIQGRGVIALLAIVAGCIAQRSGKGLVLTDGTPATGLADPNDPTVLLVYDPADCLACSGPLAAWLAERPVGAPAKLLFTRTPNRQEERALLMHHLSASAVVQWNGSLRTPRAYLVRAGNVTDSAVGAVNIQRLIATSMHRPDSGPKQGATRAAPISP